jgi:hypothetical protein
MKFWLKESKNLSSKRRFQPNNIQLQELTQVQIPTIRMIHTPKDHTLPVLKTDRPQDVTFLLITSQVQRLEVLSDHTLSHKRDRLQDVT